MRVNTNVSNKTRRELVLDDFKGVDFSSSPLKVSGSRASFASNLICDNGVNHKRPGWRQELTFSDKPINGIYEYKNDRHEVLIVYAGQTFYEVKDGTAAQIDFQADENFQLQDQKVQFFPHKDRLYIIGPGDYLVYGTWDDGASYKLRRVADDKDTYVPTVITGIEAGGSGGAPLEEINIFSKRRKVALVGAAAKTGDESTFWQIPDFLSSEKSIVISVEKDGMVYSGSPDVWGNAELVDDYTCLGNAKLSKIMDDDLYFDGRITFDCDTTPDGVAYSNITVEYESANGYAYDTEIYPFQEKLRKMRFGTLFGAYGNSDRLFLSGNSDMPNADFYSGFDDFTYFTAASQTVMGSKDVPITGYLRLSDSTLATLKAETLTEPTIYYRTAAEKEVDLPNGQKTSEVVFTRWTGGINEGCVNPYCTTLFADDNLMLSPNGVRGIVQISNTATNERYIRERDKFINTHLLKHDLLNAVGIVYKNRYYLAVDGVCYVADPRYKTYVKDDIDGSFNYEWWYWENIPARVFAIVDDELWFGTEEGMICRFDDKFTDRTYEYSFEGDVSLSDDYTINYSDNLDWIKEGQQITLLGAKEENELYIVNIEPNSDDVGGTFQLALHKDCDYESGVVTIIDYFDEVPDTFLVRVNYPQNVVSKWFSPVFDLGAFDVSKTLLSMSITVDPTVRGKVQFGYDTRDCEKTILRNSLGEGYFDYDAINFSDFSFEANFAASHTVRVKDRNFNYITFKLISDNDKDCAVCNLKAVYQYNGRLKGVH